MCAINQMNKFIPNQANLSAALGPLLKKNRNWISEEEHEKTFNKIKEAKKTENS